MKGMACRGKALMCGLVSNLFVCLPTAQHDCIQLLAAFVRAVKAVSALELSKHIRVAEQRVGLQFHKQRQ